MSFDPTFIRALSYAARQHRDQRRKGPGAEPYINHCVEVARLLAEEGGVTDVPLLCAALLHDVVEDTPATEADVRARFGDDIADLVLEVSDDKSLPKAERKRLQIVHAADASPRARSLKLADKIANVTDLIHNPPDSWPVERVRAYAHWAGEVAAAMAGAHPTLEVILAERIEALRAACDAR